MRNVPRALLKTNRKKIILLILYVIIYSLFCNIVTSSMNVAKSQFVYIFSDVFPAQDH